MSENPISGAKNELQPTAREVAMASFLVLANLKRCFPEDWKDSDIEQLKMITDLDHWMGEKVVNYTQNLRVL
jgi:hypothetical protein